MDKKKQSKLSDLTLLNLLVLIELGLMSVAVKRSSDNSGLEHVLSLLDKANELILNISVTKGINAESIAGLNMLEEIRDNYIKVIAYRDAQEHGHLSRSPTRLAK